MKSQVLHSVWCFDVMITGEARKEVWNWSLLGVKRWWIHIDCVLYIVNCLPSLNSIWTALVTNTVNTGMANNKRRERGWRVMNMVKNTTVAADVKKLPKTTRRQIINEKRKKEKQLKYDSLFSGVRPPEHQNQRSGPDEWHLHSRRQPQAAPPPNRRTEASPAGAA